MVDIGITVKDKDLIFDDIVIATRSLIYSRFIQATTEVFNTATMHSAQDVWYLTTVLFSMVTSADQTDMCVELALTSSPIINATAPLNMVENVVRAGSVSSQGDCAFNMLTMAQNYLIEIVDYLQAIVIHASES